MITVVIKYDGEDSVVELTYKNLWKELKHMPDADILVSQNWFDSLGKVKTKYVCFVEADCLVSSGYFDSQMGLFKKNPYFRKLAMLSSSTGVNDWGNKFYGYKLASGKVDEIKGRLVFQNHWIEPVKMNKSKSVYPIQVGFVPGSIMRMTMLLQALQSNPNLPNLINDLVYFSSELSFMFWKQGDGNRVHINPNATYVTTEEYVNDIGFMPENVGQLPELFKREVI